MNPKPSNKDAGSNQMMISEVKSLKERLKVLETDNKLLRSREVSTEGPVINQQEFNRVRNALLNLLVGVENQMGPMSSIKPTKEVEKAMKAAEAIIRPAAVVPQAATVVINVNRAE